MTNDKDKQSKNRIFNLSSGNYTEKIEGDFIQGNVIGNSKPTPTPRKDYSEDGDAIDVEDEKDDEKKDGFDKILDFFERLTR